MALMCDVHPQREARYHLEGPEGNCYEMCSVYELDSLLISTQYANGVNSNLPPCGHTGDYASTQGTWWQQLTDVDGKLIDLSNADDHDRTVHKMRQTGRQETAPPAKIPVQATYMSLQTALLHVLFATQDLYTEDRTNARYRRWQGWAVSWLKESMLGVR